MVADDTLNTYCTSAVPCTRIGLEFEFNSNLIRIYFFLCCIPEILTHVQCISDLKHLKLVFSRISDYCSSASRKVEIQDTGKARQHLEAPTACDSVNFGNTRLHDGVS